MKIDVPPDQSSYVLHDLEPNVNYWARVSANTRRGEGESTQIVTVTPVTNGRFPSSDHVHNFITLKLNVFYFVFHAIMMSLLF